MLAAHAVGVQSTPIIGRSGRTLGVLSTHYSRAGRTAARELRMIDLLGARLARWLEPTACHVPGDIISTARHTR